MFHAVFPESVMMWDVSAGVCNRGYHGDGTAAQDRASLQAYAAQSGVQQAALHLM